MIAASNESACFPSLRLSGCVADSIVDGPGMRFVLFVQGCPHHCPACHNPQTHDFSGGYAADLDSLMLQITENPLCTGVTFSGGEPFCQAKALYLLAQKIRSAGKDIVVYSGYTFEELLEKSEQEPAILALMRQCRLLIDGRYLQEQRDLTLPFRGSKNQRILDLKKSLSEKRAVCQEAL